MKCWTSSWSVDISLRTTIVKRRPPRHDEFLFFIFLTLIYSTYVDLYFLRSPTAFQAHYPCLVSAVVDTNDRFLRKITVGQANTEKSHSRQVRAPGAATPPCSCEAHTAGSLSPLSACSRFLCVLAACQRLSEIMAPEPNPANKQCAPQRERA